MVVPEGKNEDDDKSASQLLDGWRSGSDSGSRDSSTLGALFRQKSVNITTPPPVPPKDRKPSVHYL